MQAVLTLKLRDSGTRRAAVPMKLNKLARPTEQLEQTVDNLVLADALIAEQKYMLSEDDEVGGNIAHKCRLLRIAMGRRDGGSASVDSTMGGRNKGALEVDRHVRYVACSFSVLRKVKGGNLVRLGALARVAGSGEDEVTIRDLTGRVPLRA